MLLKQRALLFLIIVCSLCGTGRLQAQEPVLSTDTLVHPVAAQLPDSSLRALSDTLKALSNTLNPDTLNPLPADSLAIPDSLRADALPVDTLAAPVDTVRSKGMLEAPVIYQATDSIVLTGTNMAYLYGESDVKYQQIQLQAELIEMDMDKTVVSAIFGVDSLGEEFGYPLYVDGENQNIEAKSMRYNFKTKKAFASSVLTQEGEGFLTAGTTKKMADNSMNMIDGLYTTCDEHDHPHFGIKITKAKVHPGKNIVSGPAYLVIEDVPLYPIGLPFAFFPFTDTYSSGIIMPTYGDEMTQGFYLRDGGYYFALSDYVDLAATGEIYTKGSWGLGANSSYRKRYKYSGH
ncbi:MAG: LPS-assembly protein LptD, partial [Tannerella sp.]|nr:LPS-assembly protein LptD [Tannerella sp.]